jgi:hypothetical protein
MKIADLIAALTLAILTVAAGWMVREYLAAHPAPERPPTFYVGGGHG